MRKNSIVYGIIQILILVLILSFQSSAASKSKNSSNTWGFVSSDGEVCSATVETTMSQNYTLSGSDATYKTRRYWVGIGYVATHTTPNISSIVCKYVDSKNNTVRNFKWSKDSKTYLYSTNIKATWKKYNSTSIKYAKSNKKYLSLSFVVGNSGYVGRPFVSKQIKMALKI